MKTETVVQLGIFGAIAYLLYKYVPQIGGAIDSAEQSVADTWVDLTSGPSVASQLQNQVIMPNGVTFPTSSLSAMGAQFQGGNYVFTYQGSQYMLSPHDANGNYQASPY